MALVTLHACDFCGKHEDAVAVLIKGPRALICNECVKWCADFLAKEYPIPPIPATEGQS